MKYIEAPEYYHKRGGDGPSIFLLGGITACPDWQKGVVDLMADEDVVILNPRRAGFNMKDKNAPKAQVEWEYRHLWSCDYTLAWFPACDPKETVQPIALFELGAATAVSENTRMVILGVDPGYPRAQDIKLQMSHARPWLMIHDKLEDAVNEVRILAGGRW